MVSPRMTRATTKKAAQVASSTSGLPNQPGVALAPPVLSNPAPTPAATVGTSQSVQSQAAVPTSNLSATTQEATTAEARRAMVRNHQATTWSHTVASNAEPDLNDPNEVRHIEVDSNGSLTFMLLATDEAWRLREVGMDSNEKGQVIAGRFYVVERLP